MAHEFLSYRRVDRFFHRATVKFDSDSDSSRPFVVLSAKGDLFLDGQVRAMIGLFVAIVRGYVPAEILDAFSMKNIQTWFLVLLFLLLVCMLPK